MNSPVTGMAIGKDVVAALGLRNRTKAIDIRIAVDEVVSVTCEYFPDRTSIATVLKVLALCTMSRHDVGHEMVLPQRAPAKRCQGCDGTGGPSKNCAGCRGTGRALR